MRSKIRPGVPTTMRVVKPSFALFALLNMRTCPSLGTPPKTATLAIPNGFPSAESVSCVWIANSRVGATTRIDIVDFPDDVLTGESMRRQRPGIPKARVFPLE